MMKLKPLKLKLLKFKRLFFLRPALLCLAPLSLVLLCSCDLLRNGAFEVSAWSPGGGYHDAASVAELALDFSLEPDRNSVERSFSLSEDGAVMAGHFSWRGSRMIFTPAAPLIPNRDYLVILKTDAQDLWGLSLERQFEAAFSTRPLRDRPAFVSADPPDGGIIEGSRDRVELLFSGPMNRSSLGALSFSPAIAGVWSLEDEGCRAVFSPSENWAAGREYRLNAGDAIKNEVELEAGREWILHFSAGLDREAPVLLRAAALDAGDNAAMILAASVIPPGPSGETENAGWERGYRLALEFSEPVDTSSVTAALNCEPALGMILETLPGYRDRIVYRFAEAPVYGGAYTLTLERSLRDEAGNTMEEKIRWRIRADGPLSKPPLLRAMRFPAVPGSEEKLLVYRTEDLFKDFPVRGEHYAFDTPVSSWMELYFETAPGASIDTLSLMNHFTVNATNKAFIFSARSVEPLAFTVAAPAAAYGNLCRVEIRGIATNRPYTGMITIETGAGLLDTLGNKSAETARFLLLK